MARGVPSGTGDTLTGVLLITCTCSDGDCAVDVEVAAPSVEAAERELCTECGCVVQVVGVSELVLVRPARRRVELAA